MIRVSLAILAVGSSKDYYVRLKYNLVLAAGGWCPVQMPALGFSVLGDDCESFS